MIYKLYNPFKMQVVKVGDQYGIRKFSIFGWAYADLNDHQYWWGSPHQIKKWSLSKDLNAVKSLFDLYQGIKKPTRVEL